MNVEEMTLECKRCGHKWLPRVIPPIQCPKCKSYYWEDDKVLDKRFKANRIIINQKEVEKS